MILIVGGSPGTGKTTIARNLAERTNRGVHLHTDDFFKFIPNKLDPSSLSAQAQNEAVLKAWCAAALAYQDAGYEVVVDGVIGPWWFDELKRTFGGFRYLLLVADLEVCLQRCAERPGQASANPDVVRRMHEQFARLSVNYAGRLIDTGVRDIDDVLRRIDQLGDEILVL